MVLSRSVPAPAGRAAVACEAPVHRASSPTLAQADPGHQRRYGIGGKPRDRGGTRMEHGKAPPGRGERRRGRPRGARPGRLPAPGTRADRALPGRAPLRASSRNGRALVPIGPAAQETGRRRRRCGPRRRSSRRRGGPRGSAKASVRRGPRGGRRAEAFCAGHGGPWPASAAAAVSRCPPSCIRGRCRWRPVPRSAGASGWRGRCRPPRGGRTRPAGSRSGPARRAVRRPGSRC